MQIDCNGDKNIDNLYKRSILVFKLMSDERTGGLLASAEIDEDLQGAGAMHTAGKGCGIYYRRTGYRRAYRSSGQILPVGCYDQDDDGSWQQRYHMDGNLAPSWGLQIDETGTLIWGMLKHYEVTKNIDFLKACGRA